ncbi:unnamed protein product [Didymodactylos carnosus]|uniref:HEAT repeat domain-containing protein n=1 Tax=Didymodactylos carnosus TaxID=1234261 RepID=A0A815A7R5_9BILA|nr:unnamed protein product [Didymodactylos carnosus]CAF1252966.1 unnamed protein product [Didymodactylos carnosus]CAF3732916.1 unnamed protein product [Didymodactylos carnosus]CAF4023408.1 unnamed protein product [Didymodactylos carnosus]
MGEKAATAEVIEDLATALGDEHVIVRWHACKALAEIGEKAATVEVIADLATALGDLDYLHTVFGIHRSRLV